MRPLLVLLALLFAGAAMTCAAQPSALRNAVRQNNCAKVAAIVKRAVQPEALNEALFYAAAYEAAPKIVALLLAHGADVNAVTPGDGNMTTALVFAASHGARDNAQANGRNAYDLAQSGWTSNMQPCGPGVLSQLSNLH